MIGALQRLGRSPRVAIWGTVGVVLAGTAVMASRPSSLWLVLIGAGLGTPFLLAQPCLGLIALVVAALVVPLEFGTGTEVSVNTATMLVPTLFALWAVDGVLRRDLHLPRSPTTAPLVLFVLSGLLSLAIGNLLWDPLVPRSGSFVMVQLGQWAIFAFSAIAFWLAASLIQDQGWLRRLTWTFLALGGVLALLTTFGTTRIVVTRVATAALIRAPFWMLLGALAGGQLLFNRNLGSGQRTYLLTVLGAVLYHAFVRDRETASTWVGVAAVAAMLAWLRFPRLRPLAIVALLLLVGTGVLLPAVYTFAGGTEEWTWSGGSRLELIRRVLEVSKRNLITGLGPASYRRYAAMEPLSYRKSTWWAPQVSSHNNYVDLIAQVGVLGLGIFAWFMARLGLLGLRLRADLQDGFRAGYVNGVLAAWAGALVIMMLADWVLPFVYNIGFPGFQASVLLWVFLGGLVALEQIDRREAEG